MGLSCLDLGDGFRGNVQIERTWLAVFFFFFFFFGLHFGWCLGKIFFVFGFVLFVCGGWLPWLLNFVVTGVLVFFFFFFFVER